MTYKVGRYKLAPYSVLMSVYDKELPENLNECLESMLMQTYPPSDFVLVCDGKLTAIIVPVEGGFLGLGSKERIVIPWEKIVRIGEDVILVNAEGLLPLPSKKKCK